MGTGHFSGDYLGGQDAHAAGRVFPAVHAAGWEARTGASSRG